MKDAFVLVVTTILFFACTGPTIAQEIPLKPELKNWEPVLGKWKAENEIRDNPTDDWKKGPSVSVDVRSGGFFVEFRGTGEMAGEEYSFIEILGYDPIQRTYVSSSFSSNGGRGVVTSEGWNGTTVTVNFTRFTPEREVQVRRNTWEYSSDFKSVTLTGEQFTDGNWWISTKGKGTKVD